MATSGITQQELIQWGGAGVFNQALALVNSGDVTKADYDDDKLEIRGRIEQPDGWEMPVSFHLDMRGHRDGFPAAAVKIRGLESGDHLTLVPGVKEIPGAVQAHAEAVSLRVQRHVVGMGVQPVFPEISGIG